MSISKQRNFRFLNQSVDYHKKQNIYKQTLPRASMVAPNPRTSVITPKAKKQAPFRNSVVYDSSQNGYKTIEHSSRNPDTFSADNDGAVRINSKESIQSIQGKMVFCNNPPNLSMRNSMHEAGVTTSPSIDDQRIMLTKLISKNKKSLDRGFLVTQKSTDEDSSKKYMNSL